MMNHTRLSLLVAAISLTAACGGGVTGLPQPSPSAEPTPVTSAPAGQYEPGQIIVKYRAGASPRALSGTRTGQSVTAAGTGGGFTFVVVQVPEGREAEYIAEYSRQPGVEYAELNLRYFLIDAERVSVASSAPSTGRTTEPLPAISPTDSKLNEFHSAFQVARLDGTMTPASQATWQWDMHRINAPSAWASVNGAGVKVAITDTGIDCTHPQLAGRCLAGYDTNSNVVIAAGANSDNAGHGTHVSGTVAAVADGADMVGIAPGAQLIPIAMFLPAPVSGSLTTVQGILKAVELGCDVFNASWGSSIPSRASFDAVDHAVKNNCVPVFSSGNSFTPSNRLSYPASFAATHSGVIAVASSTPTDRVSTFSSAGSYVTVAAPGDAIYSLYTLAQGANGFLQGTSMAAPHVTGVVALMLEKNPSLTPAQVKTILQNTARKPCSTYAKPDYGGGNCAGYSPGAGSYGWGILDAGAAVAATP